MLLFFLWISFGTPEKGHPRKTRTQMTGKLFTKASSPGLADVGCVANPWEEVPESRTHPAS